MKIEKPTIRDVEAIHALISSLATTGVLLPRSRQDICRNIREFTVCRDEERHVVGCVALRVMWDALAEIRSLAVDEDCRNMGIGRMLVESAVEEAGRLGVRRVFALTREVEFFLRLKFHPVDKKELPQKIWSDCINCPKFPDCDEEAVVLDLEEGRSD